MIDLEKTKLTEFTTKCGRKVKMLATITVASTKVWIGAEFSSPESFNLRKYNRHGECCEIRDHNDYDLAPYFEITASDVWRIAKTAEGKRVMIAFFDEEGFHGCMEGCEELECWDANGVMLYGVGLKHSLVAWE